MSGQTAPTIEAHPVIAVLIFLSLCVAWIATDDYEEPPAGSFWGEKR